MTVISTIITMAGRISLSIGFLSQSFCFVGPREGGAQRRAIERLPWVPAFAGMTTNFCHPPTFVIPGRCAAANPQPTNTDGAGLAKVHVHGFPLSRE
jgi:hypothetical protein